MAAFPLPLRGMEVMPICLLQQQRTCSFCVHQLVVIHIIVSYVSHNKHDLVRQATHEHAYTVSNRALTMATLCRHSADTP